MKTFFKIGFVILVLVPFSLLAEVEVKVIKTAEDVPGPFTTLWKPGDYVVTDGSSYALLGGTSRPLISIMNYPAPDALGSILSFVPSGKNLSNDLNIGAPILRFKAKPVHPGYSSVSLVKGKAPEEGVAFEATAVFLGKEQQKASVKTVYRFFTEAGRIDISSTITNTGAVDIKDLSYSLYMTTNQTYSFGPYNREKYPELNFRVSQKKGHNIGWISYNPVEKSDSPLPGTLAPGKQYQVSYTLLAYTEAKDLLGKVYEILEKDVYSASVAFKDFRGKYMELIVQDAFSSSVFFRAFLDKPLSCEIPLPQGTYRVTANFYPAVREALLKVEENGAANSLTLEDPAKGTVKVRIRNSRGGYVPGKVTFIGLYPTKSPYFQPDNPVETERNYESFKNSLYPKEEGEEVKIPAGTYLVYASRGPEYSLDQKVIEVLQDVPLEIVFTVDKVVETKGLISIDPHLHTQYSDSAVRIPDRLKSIVAEGVDLAIATDHNYVTDYGPALKSLGLNPYLAVLTGEEVTPLDSYIHFNNYPLARREEEQRKGAISPEGETVAFLFEESRKKSQGGILQLNHPRAGRLGYFNNSKLDKETAAHVGSDNFTLAFDLMEVMNGPAYHSSNDDAVEDWLHLVNRGYFFPVTASSDSHSADGQEPGYSRVYVQYTGEKGDRLEWGAVAEALKKGRSFISNGPLVDFKVNTRYGSGDTFSEKSGKVNISVRVQSAPWVSVDEVRLIVNGTRRIIFPVKAKESEIQKFSEDLQFGLKQDSSLAVEVLGGRSLFPVVQQASGNGTMEEAPLPYALTNPVFVDVDGNGKFDPPLPKNIEVKK